MKLILTGTATLSVIAALAAAALAEPASTYTGTGERVGASAASAVATVDEAYSANASRESIAASGALPDTRPHGRCTPGPSRLSDFAVGPGGYLHFPRSDNRRFHEFYFTRAIYSGDARARGGNYLGDGGPPWSIDYPDADRTMMVVAKRLANINACEWENPISLADPELRRFPFLYSLEWGWANLSEAEVRGLRSYLLAGGLLMLDDFWGSWEWANLEHQMRRILPNHRVEDIPRDHVLFRSYYDIVGDIVQVPNVGNGRAVGMGIPGARTSEQDGFQAHVRGIFDDTGRLMVVINWNTDLGDALEWAEDPSYPLHFSRFASELFMNTIIYAMTQ